MSTETLIKKNSKLDPCGSEKIYFDTQISNLDLNKLKNNTLNKKETKTCIKTLQEKLRKKKVKEKFEKRILYGLFISVIAVLFYVST